VTSMLFKNSLCKVSLTIYLSVVAFFLFEASFISFHELGHFAFGHNPNHSTIAGVERAPCSICSILPHHIVGSFFADSEVSTVHVIAVYYSHYREPFYKTVYTAQQPQAPPAFV